jgi:hypothetical protein
MRIGKNNVEIKIPIGWNKKDTFEETKIIDKINSIWTNQY